MATKLPMKPLAKVASKSVAKPKAAPGISTATKTRKPSATKAAPTVANTTKKRIEEKPKSAVTKTTTALKTELKPIKVKIIRDSFTMTDADHELIKRCKRGAVAKGRETRKSEVVRAAVAAFAAWPLEQQLLAYGKLTTVKTGRPRKEK
jgi:hypothetical protein